MHRFRNERGATSDSNCHGHKIGSSRFGVFCIGPSLNSLQESFFGLRDPFSLLSTNFKHSPWKMISFFHNEDINLGFRNLVPIDGNGSVCEVKVTGTILKQRGEPNFLHVLSTGSLTLYSAHLVSVQVWRDKSPYCNSRLSCTSRPKSQSRPLSPKITKIVSLYWSRQLKLCMQRGEMLFVMLVKYQINWTVSFR